eukprot:CAMPEP_0204831148 /NCGR_PEP_ID=MMETSP1346-20131115/9991_1 /ASSEMBLY_ACC=CAM_ASM_000771 /TAXON_ID=215587 /ORGANISM="Aplanochytrium stocchinoi, Strain GSBS06" /LENGTH=423 /DNA_ID=CAMNT_0051961943 /DNA_START=135 /DNA_END=1406 /DNA_ORIENTATION=-
MFGWKISTIGIVAFAVLVFFIANSLNDANIKVQPVTCDKFPSICNEPTTGTPKLLEESISFGRFRNPTHEIKFSSDVYRENQFFKLKRWHYMAVNFENYFFAAAIVQLNYIADVFVYVVDKRKRNEKVEYHTQRPLGFGVKFAPGSMNGCSFVTKSWFSTEIGLKICYKQEGYWEIETDVLGYSDFDGSAKSIVSNIRVKRATNDALAFTFPLGASPLRPAYVHKGAGMKAKGYLSIGEGGDIQQEIKGSSGIDWTHALALHHTQWKWVSFNSMETTTRIFKNGSIEDRKTYTGINLSDKVYDFYTKTGNRQSIENAIWIDSRVVAFRYPVEISMPENGEISGPWLIKSIKPNTEESIDLQFIPISAREDHVDLSYIGLVSDFVQPYGYFNGTVTVTDEGEGTTYIVFFKDVFGVVENHNALW